MSKENIVVHKAIVHYLNKETNTVLLTDYENTNDVELIKGFKKALKSVSKNEYSRKAKFQDYSNNDIKKYADGIMYDESSFVENSKEIAKKLYESMQLSENIESGCLAIGLFTVDEEKQVGLFKINFKKSYTKEIKETRGSGLRMNIIKKDDLIPENMSTTQAAIIYASGLNDEYHLCVLDKKPEKEQLDSDFIQKFLCSNKVEDDTYKTRVLKDTIEGFITNAYGDDLKEGEGIRSYLTRMLKDETVISPKELVNSLIDDEYKRDTLLEVLNEKIENLDEQVELDNEWIDKKTKNRTLKTDVGLIIKGKMDDFEDPMKYSLVKNSDGSVNIVIKNVLFFE